MTPRQLVRNEVASFHQAQGLDGTRSWLGGREGLMLRVRDSESWWPWVSAKPEIVEWMAPDGTTGADQTVDVLHRLQVETWDGWDVAWVWIGPATIVS